MPHQIKTQQVFLSCQFWNWSGKFDYWWGDILGFRPLDRYRIKLNQPVPSSSRQEHRNKVFSFLLLVMFWDLWKLLICQYNSITTNNEITKESIFLLFNFYSSMSNFSKYPCPRFPATFFPQNHLDEFGAFRFQADKCCGQSHGYRWKNTIGDGGSTAL